MSETIELVSRPSATLRWYKIAWIALVLLLPSLAIVLFLQLPAQDRIEASATVAVMALVVIIAGPLFGATLVSRITQSGDSLKVRTMAPMAGSTTYTLDDVLWVKRSWDHETYSKVISIKLRGRWTSVSVYIGKDNCDVPRLMALDPSAPRH